MAQREYDIFEKFPDGGEVWRGVGAGLDDLRTRLDQLAQQSENAFFALPVRVSRKVYQQPLNTENRQVCSG